MIGNAQLYQNVALFESLFTVKISLTRITLENLTLSDREYLMPELS